jgi:YVTN family beta-propeller protein
MRLLAIVLAALGVATGAAHVTAKIKLAANTQPCAAAAGGGFVWVSEYASPWLVKIDPKTNKVLGKTPIGFGSCGLGYGAGSLWIEDTSSGTVSRVSVRTGKRVKAIPVGAQPYDATFAYGAAWATSNGVGELERIDPAKNRVVKRWKLTGAVGVVGAFDSIWGAGSNGVLRIDPVTNKVVATIAAPGAGWTAASGDAVWVTTSGGAVARIDPATNTVAARVGLKAAVLGDPAVVGGMLWVPQVRENSIAVVDPATNTVVQTVKAGAGPFVVTEIAGEAWVPSWHGSDVWRFRP